MYLAESEMGVNYEFFSTKSDVEFKMTLSLADQLMGHVFPGLTNQDKRFGFRHANTRPNVS